MRVARDHRREICPEEYGEVLAFEAQLFDSDAELCANPTVGAVRTDEEACANVVRRVVCGDIATVRSWAQARRHAAAGHVEADQFGSEPDLAALGQEVLEQNRLEVVLRADGDRARADRLQVVGGRDTERDLLLSGIGERRGHGHSQPDLLRTLAHLLLEPPAAQDFQCSQPDAGRLGEDRGADVLLDDQDA